PPLSNLFPYTTLFRSKPRLRVSIARNLQAALPPRLRRALTHPAPALTSIMATANKAVNCGSPAGKARTERTSGNTPSPATRCVRSEEHTSELQSRGHL